MLLNFCVNVKRYFSNDISPRFPAIVASYTVHNELVAMAYYGNMGLLYYRTALLRQYGYGAPPRTWDELASMAARFQAGGGGKRKSGFWGLVAQGAGEGLTCHALGG